MPRCNHCNTETTEVFAGLYDDTYCSACFHRYYYHCEECGRPEYHYEVVGGHICRRCAAGRLYWGPTEVKPTTCKKTGTTRCFGIELETSQCTDHWKYLRGKTRFGAKVDGSVAGLEFYSPILSGDSGLAEVRKFCRLAKTFAVNEECGFHLHIDMRGTDTLQRKRIVFAYRLTLKLWQQLVAEDRWRNSFCGEPNYTPSEIATTPVPESLSRSRYEFVNIRAFHSHTTYELRGHQGTLDAKQICNWVKAHLRFVEFVKEHDLSELATMFSTHRKAKRTMRKIFGVTLSNYYSKLWRKHTHRLDNRPLVW